MPSPVDIIECLDAIHRAVVTLAEHGDDGVVEVGSALLRWVEQPDGSTTLDAELDLPPGWRTEARRRARDDALVRLARKHFPALQGRAVAGAVAAAARRYEGTSWPRDRRAQRRPDGLSGDLFDVLSFSAMPSQGTLRRIFKTLSGSNGPVEMSQCVDHAA
jgi:hypothetical protein